MIKNIVFDLGGVIIDFDPIKTVSCFFPDPDDTELVLKEVFKNEIWLKSDAGLISREELADTCRKRLPESMGDIIHHLLTNWWDYMLPIPEMYHLIKQLHKNGYKIYLLSNCSVDMYDHAFMIPALRFFDGLIASAEYKVLKPGHEIFEILFDKFSIRPEESFFVDDVKKYLE